LYFYDRLNLPENLEVEPEEEVDADEKGSFVLQSEVEKAIKEIRDKKVTEDDDVPGDVPKRLGEDGITIMTQRSTKYMKLEGGPRISLKLQ
jgi:hypothetical protein